MPQSLNPAPTAESRGVEPLDAAAFAGLYESARHRLTLLAYGLTADRHLAEDVVQEAASLALNKVDRFDPGTNFTAWVAQFVRFVASNQRRRRARRSTLSLDAQVLPEPVDPPRSASEPVGRAGELRSDQSSFDDDLTRALEDLSSPARACLLLRTVSGLDYAEIAEILEIPEGTAMSHVYRARRKMRASLKDTQGGSPA